jgi:hypothetical protein
MGQILYEVRISKLPLNDLERFHSNVLKHVAVHIPDRLLELLIEGLSSEEEARSALNEAVAGGGPVEVRLREDAPLQVIDKLATSSWREGNEMNNSKYVVALRTSKVVKPALWMKSKKWAVSRYTW